MTDWDYIRGRAATTPPTSSTCNRSHRLNEHNFRQCYLRLGWPIRGGRADANTKVHVIIGNRKVIGIESASLTENAFSYYHASRGHGCVIANEPGAVVISARVAIKLIQDMTSGSTKPQHDAGVLQPTVGKK
jgi:hypothetical protein